MRLRIITGEFRGRLIDAPQSDHTRPTTERVRESIFNYLTNRISFEDISVLDIYAGSGSLGFEAVSRGATTCVFIEKNFAPHKVLQQNIVKLGLSERCTVVKTAAAVFCKRPASRPFDLILADPPFFAYDVYEVLEGIKTNNLLAPGGTMIIERSVQTLDKDIVGLGKEPYKKIGDSCLYEFIAEELSA